MDHIYVDNAATTRISPRALAAMLPFYESFYANPSAIHRAGQDARKALEAARRQVAACLGAMPSEIFFTSGGTESDNWAVKSAALAAEKTGRGRHMVAAAFEHKAILRPLEVLAEKGWEIDLVNPGFDGLMDPERVSSLIRPDTALVSVMAANNVVGTIQPIKELAAAAHAKGALFHTDAVQASGHVPIDVREWGVDMLSISAHKFHGPKGAGALFAKVPRLPHPLIDGGGQERGGRGGTENVPGAVGLAEALAESVERMDEDAAHLTKIRNFLIERVLALDRSALAGDGRKRLPGHACFVFYGLDKGANLVAALDEAGISASSGSACSAASKEASHVLTSMGVMLPEPHHSLRISLSRWNTEAEMGRVADRLEEALPGLRVHRPRRSLRAVSEE